MEPASKCLIGLLMVIGLCCVFLTGCTPTTSTPVTEPVMTATARETPARSAAPILFFARDDDLWRADLNGDDVERLTEEGTLNWQMERGDDLGNVWVNATMYRPPQVSPDGRWISLSRTGLDLILVNVAAHTQKKLPKPGAPIVAWSPDSRFFAYVPESTTDENDLYRNSVLDLDNCISRCAQVPDKCQTAEGDRRAL